MSQFRVQFRFINPDLDLGFVLVTDQTLYGRDPEVIKAQVRGGHLPLGYRPIGQTAIGWRSREEALAIAGEYDVELEEDSRETE